MLGRIYFYIRFVTVLFSDYNLIIISFYVYACFAGMSVALYVYSARGSKKMVSDPLAL